MLLPELPAERTGHEPPPELAERRAQAVAAAKARQWQTEPAPGECRLAGLRALRFVPQGVPVGRVLHFHGGGFRLGFPEMTGPFAAALAKVCGVEVVVPQYRLAPEHPFPAGLNDGFAALQALAGERGGPLILSGDSAGGGLAASLMLLAAQAGITVAGLVLLSPWLDLTVSAPAYGANADSDPLFSRASAMGSAALYLQGLEPEHPLVSPLFAPLPQQGWPRTLISVGSGEVLVDDARRFHGRLVAAGFASLLLEIAGMSHVAVVRATGLPGAAETFAALTHLLDDITKGRPLGAGRRSRLGAMIGETRGGGGKRA